MMSVLVSLLLTIRSSVRSRGALQLEVPALRHQLRVSGRRSFRNDLSSIRRRLRRRPGDFLITAATLALVLGVGASVFAMVNGTMLRPLPFPDQDRLVRVFTMPPGATESRSRSPLASVDFVRFHEGTRTLDRLEVIWQRERSLVGGAGDPAIVKAERSPRTFRNFAHEFSSFRRKER